VYECKPLADGDIMFLSYKYIWHQGPGYAGELDSVFAAGAYTRSHFRST